MENTNESGFNIEAAKESIKKAQKAGDWPTLPEAPKRTHEEAMTAFNKMETEHRQIEEQEKQMAEMAKPFENPIPYDSQETKTAFQKFADWLRRNRPTE